MYQGKELFLIELNKFIEKHIRDSNKDLFYLDFMNATAPIGRKKIDLSPYPNIVSQYPKAERLLKCRWDQVEYMSHEQFLHDASKGYYTLRTMELPPTITLHKMLVPSLLIMKYKQDLIYLI